MEKEGWIYIMSNPVYGNKLKVGKTKNHPEIRGYGMSKRTEIIEDFKVEWFIRIPDIDIAELLAHDSLKSHRVKPKKEFFKIELNLAIDKISKTLCEYFNIDEPQIYRNKEVIDQEFQSSNIQIDFKGQNFRNENDFYYFKYNDKDEHFDILKNRLKGSVLEEMYRHNDIIISVEKEKDGTISTYQAIYQSDYVVEVKRANCKDELEFYFHFFNPDFDNYTINNKQIKKAGMINPNKIFYKKLEELLSDYQLVAEGYDRDYDYFRTNCILIKQTSKFSWNVRVITHPQKYYFLVKEDADAPYYSYCLSENGSGNDYQNLNWRTFFSACRENDISKYGFLIESENSNFIWLVAHISMYADDMKYIHNNLDSEIREAVSKSIKRRYPDKHIK
jgi:T5orf172 domain